MSKFCIKLKGIVRYNDRFLLVKKWYDDRITEPFQWEFVDTQLVNGANPDDTILESINNATGLNVTINRIIYTWTYTVGENEYVGIAYLCDAADDTVFLSEELNSCVWVKKEELSQYIDNRYLLEDVLRGLNQ